MTTCGACGKRAKKTRTAMILRGPGKAKRGRVCRECAALGWLFVIGSDIDAPSSKGTPRSTKRAPKVLEKYGFGIRERSPDKAPPIAAGRKARAELPKTVLPQGEHRTLLAIVLHGPISRESLSVLTGYRKSTRDLYVRRLAARNLVIVEGGEVSAEDGAADHLPDYEPLPTGKALREYWLAKLPGGERTILAFLTRANTPIMSGRDEISERCGYLKSTRDLYVRRLAARKLVRVQGTNVVAASELFS